MKRILIVALLMVCAQPVEADEPREIPMTGSMAADSVIALANAMNRQMKMIEDDSNIVTEATNHYAKLKEMEAKILSERKKVLELDKQLQTQEGDLKANYDRERAGKSDAERDALEDVYKARKKELDDARKQVSGLPKQLEQFAKLAESQAKILKSVKSVEDWVDPKTGQGKLRAQFQLRRNKLNEASNKIATTTEKVKQTLDKGSSLDFKGERAGAFEGVLVGVASGSPEWEWTVNGQKPAKGKTFTIGDDRTIKIQVKLVEDRRKQSRTIKSGGTVTAKVNQKDYDFEYGNDTTSSHWTVAEEEYSDWKVDHNTARDPGVKDSSSGVFATVKGDVMTITFSPDTATEDFHVSVIGRIEWKMEGRRGGGPVMDKADASGNWWIDLKVTPRK
jgi:hypothetical protein